jgi:chromosome segregation ATPase
MQTSDNSNSQTLALSAKNSKPSKTLKNSQPSKVKITKATKEQIKKAPKIIIDSDTEDDIGNNSDEDHFIEPSDDWTSADFEINYRKLLFFHNALKEEHQGAHEEINGLKKQLADAREEVKQFKGFSEYAFNTCQEERENVLKMKNEKTEVIREKITIINSLKFQLQKATADALKLNDTVKNLQEEIKILKDNEDDEETRQERINHLERTVKNIKRKYDQEQDDNQELIKERDNLQFKNDGLQLTIDNLNTELKDLKIYADDNERNFFKIKEENQELENRIEKLEYNLDIEYKKSFYGGSEKTLNLEKIKRLEDLIREKDDSNQELKRKLSDVDIERCNYKSELECLRVDLKEITTKYNQIDSDNSDYIHELQDLKVAFKEMKEKNIKLNEGMGVFARQILDLELKIKKLIIMLEEYEALGALPNSMKWTLQCKLETFLKPDFKPVVDYPRHIINLGNGEFY